MERKNEMETDSGLILNEYFERKISKDRTLVSTRHGTWLILDKVERGLLRNGGFRDNVELFRKLKREGIVLTNENAGFVVDRLRHMFKEFDQSSFVCVVNVTEMCNLNCAYCLADAGMHPKHKDMSVETMEKLMEFINSAPWKYVSFEFQGGESLARFDLVKMFVEMAEKRIAPNKIIKSYSIVTNLTLMNEDIADYLIRKKFNIGSSLDGPKELHDAQRPFSDGSGTYEKAIHWGRYLKSRGAHVGFSPTITKRSIEAGARAIIDEYIQQGMEYILFRPVTMCGRASGDERLAIGALEFFEFYRDGIEYMVELAGKGTDIHEKKFKAMLKNIFTPYRNYMCMRRPCGACMSQMSFAPDGTIYACDSGKGMEELKVGNLSSDAYADVVMNSLPLRALTSEEQPLCDRCAYTAFCGSCASRIVTSWKDTKIRTPKDFDCQIHRMVFDYIFSRMDDERYMKVFKKWIGCAECADNEHTGI